MTNHWEVLQLKPGSRKDEIEAAFEAVLADRRAKRQKTSDVHVAHSILSDDALRRTYDLALRGSQTGERIVGAKDAVVEAVTDAIPEIRWFDVKDNAVRTTLQAAVLATEFTARVSDATGRLSRRLHSLAARQLSIRH